MDGQPGPGQPWSGQFGPLPEPPDPTPPATPDPHPPPPAVPRVERHYVKRGLAWLALLLCGLWMIPAVAVGLDQLKVGHTPVQGNVVTAEGRRIQQRFERCDLTVEFPQDGRRRSYTYEAEAPCGDLPQPGRPLTVYVPDNRDDRRIIVETQERHDRVGAYVATVGLPLCPLVAIGLPAGLYLRRERRERKAEERRGTRLA